MRIMTWNIQWGRGMDGRVDLGRIAEIVRANDPDIICFQEVASGFGDLAGNDDADQFAALARLFPRHEAHAGIALDVRSSSGTRKTFGNLLLSRLPVASVRRHALPWSTVDGRECMPRGLIEAVIETPGGPLRVMTTHLE